MALSAACSAPSVAGPTVLPPPLLTSRATSASTTSATPTLPAGVLLDEQGAFGRVRIEERDGLRRLTVGGELMGAVPVERVSAPPEGDPLVELLALTERRGLAVVVGLGTGRTATELARRGEVLVVERDPLVVRAAREHYDFRGAVEMASAADFIARATANKKKIDLLVLDVFGASTAADEEILAGALAFVRASSSTDFPRTGPLLALRFWGAPGGERAERVRGALRRVLGYVELFGSGVGSEAQTLYVLAAPAPENLVAPAERGSIAAWRIPDDELGRASRRAPERVGVGPGGGSAASSEAAPDRVEREHAREREIELAGYLVRSEDGTLCLDLPHYEMGAQRYRLRGTHADDLAQLLPASARFPTSGDIGSDGPTEDTLRDVMGGGGFKRNETRFSPVAVALRGRAKLVAFVHPDASAFVPAAGRGREPDHAALRYGGTLYELDVDRVLGTIDLGTWRRSLPGLRAALPLRAIEQGELAKAAASAAPMRARLSAVVGAVAPFAAEVRLVGRALGAIERHARDDGGELARAVACDWALTETAVDPAYAGPLSIALDGALLSCATRFYERALGPKPSPSSEPARRLLAIYRARSFWGPTFEKKAAALEARLPGLEELDTPPGGFGLPLH